MKTCPKCGNSHFDFDSRCSKCDIPLPEKTENQSINNSSPKNYSPSPLQSILTQKFSGPLGCLILLIVIIIVSGLLNSCHSSTDLNKLTSPPAPTISIEELREKVKAGAVLEQYIYRRYDKVENINWIYAKGDDNNIYGFKFIVYIGEDASKSQWIRLVAGLHRGNWIFFNRITILADEKRFDIPFNFYKDKKTEVGGGIYEWVDIPIDPAETGSLWADIKGLSSAKSVTIRFSGDKYYDDYTLSSTQKTRIKRIFDYLDYSRIKSELLSREGE